MVAKVCVSKSPIEGSGVFAYSDLVAGEVVLRIDDSFEVDSQHSGCEGEKLHFDYLAGGRVVWMQSPERYIDHSCKPNVYVHTREGVREVIALRPVQKGKR